jgi:hypothetical protein
MSESFFDTKDDETEEISFEKMHVKIAFFKGDKKRFHHRFIRWWTKSIYSHAELVLPDGETWVSISPFIYSQVGARIKTHFEESEWDFIIFEASEKQVQSLKDFISETTGDGYDWPGMLMSQVLPFIIKSRQKWYCSSWIAHALSHAGIIKWRRLGIYEIPDLHPGKLHHLLSKVKDS